MDFLFKKRDSRQLGFLRIVIGSWFLIDILSMLVSGYVKEAYVTPEMNFHFYGFEWIKPLPDIWMYVLFIGLGILSIGIITGYLFRLSTSLFLIGFSYVFMCDIVYTLNKFYLFIILGIVLLITHADRSLALNSKTKFTYIAAWQILIFQFLVGLIYTFSGLSKLNTDWLLHAEPLIFFFEYRIPFKWLPDDIYIWTVFAFTYLGLTFDLSITWLLVYKKTNLFANIWQGLFHFLNFTTLFIGSLSIFMGLLTWLLFPTNWLLKKLKFSPEPSLEAIQINKSIKSTIFSGLLLFSLINIAIPLRHFIVGTEVNLTEKGHRFSWRLMTRTKRGSQANFTVVDNISGERIFINPRKHLTGRQYRKMAGETDLIITFAHYLHKKHSKIQGHENLSVYTNALVKLNGRKKQYLVEKTLDLTKVSRSFLIDPISLPMKKRK